MKIFALVHVVYDHYRFEGLKGIGCCDKEALIKEFNESELDVLEYGIGDCPSEIESLGVSHIWIYEIEV